MPTPLGHGIIGLAVYGAFAHEQGRQSFLTKKEIGICLLCSYAPDLDFIPGVLSEDHFAFHHGPSHSFVFGIVFGVLLAALLGRFRPEPFWKGAALYTVLIWLHLLLDMCIVDNRTTAAHGLQIFYPFSSMCIKSPVDIFFVDLGSGGSLNLLIVLTPDNLLALVMEVIAAGVIGYVLFKLILKIRSKLRLLS